MNIRTWRMFQKNELISMLLCLMCGIFIIISLVPLTNQNPKTNRERRLEPYNDTNLDQEPNMAQENAPFSSAETLRPAVHINNNWSLTKASYSWCTGNGLSNDPYIIDGLVLNLTDVSNASANIGILIESSSDYFIIRNCTIYSNATWIPKNDLTGIQLQYVQNGEITDCLLNHLSICIKQNNNTNCKISDIQIEICSVGILNANLTQCHIETAILRNISGSGISLDKSNGVSITFCALWNCSAGISCSNSNGCTFSNCKIIGGKGTGISLSMCTFCLVENNNVFHQGYIGLNGYYGESNIIRNCFFFNNTYSGIRLHNMKSLIICDNIIQNTSSRYHSSDDGVGIICKWMSDLLVENNTCFANVVGIFVGDWVGNGNDNYLLRNITIRKNNCSFNRQGIWVNYLIKSKIQANICFNNSKVGIIVYDSDFKYRWGNKTDNEISFNSLKYNLDGLQLSTSCRNNISYNDISENTGSGLVFEEESYMNSVKKNNITDNRIGISLGSDCEWNWIDFSNKVTGNLIWISGIWMLFGGQWIMYGFIAIFGLIMGIVGRNAAKPPQELVNKLQEKRKMVTWKTLKQQNPFFEHVDPIHIKKLGDIYYTSWPFESEILTFIRTDAFEEIKQYFYEIYDTINQVENDPTVFSPEKKADSYHIPVVKEEKRAEGYEIDLQKPIPPELLTKVICEKKTNAHILFVDAFRKAILPITEKAKAAGLDEFSIFMGECL